MDRRTERTRAAVVNATVNLVADQGSQVGMTEIAHAAGVSRKAVYENFGTRDKVLLSTTETLLSNSDLKDVEPDQEHSNPLDVALPPLVQHLEKHRRYYRAVLSGPAGGLVLRTLVDRTVKGLSELRDHGLGAVASDVTRLRDRFVVHGLIGVLMDALSDRPDVDLTDLARTLNSSLGGTTFQE